MPEKQELATKQVTFKVVPYYIDTPKYERPKPEASPPIKSRHSRCIPKTVIETSTQGQEVSDVLIQEMLNQVTNLSIPSIIPPVSPNRRMFALITELQKPKLSTDSVASIGDEANTKVHADSTKSSVLVGSVTNLSKTEMRSESSDQKPSLAQENDGSVLSQSSDLQNVTDIQKLAKISRFFTNFTLKEAATKYVEPEGSEKPESDKSEKVENDGTVTTAGEPDVVQLSEQKEAYPDRWQHRKLIHVRSKLKSIMKKPNISQADKAFKIHKQINAKAFQKKVVSKRSSTAKNAPVIESVTDVGKKRSQSAKPSTEGGATESLIENVTVKEGKNEDRVKEEQVEEEAMSLAAKIEKYNQQMTRMRTLTFGLDKNNTTEEPEEGRELPQQSEKDKVVSPEGCSKTLQSFTDHSANEKSRTVEKMKIETEKTINSTKSKSPEAGQKESVSKVITSNDAATASLDDQYTSDTTDTGGQQGKLKEKPSLPKGMFVSDIEEIKKSLRDKEKQEVEMEKLVEVKVKKAVVRFQELIKPLMSEKKEKSEVQKKIDEFVKQTLKKKGILLSESEESGSDSVGTLLNSSCSCCTHWSTVFNSCILLKIFTIILIVINIATVGSDVLACLYFSWLSLVFVCV